MTLNHGDLASAQVYLQEALSQARRGQGFCAPNPAVGALVVKNQKVLASGYHQACGHPHAEAEALHQLGIEQTAGSTLYVTLEPCCHYGRTPPCSDLIIASKISKVVYASVDPNPQISGKGIEQLREAGLVCQHVPLASITRFYRSYAHWQRTGMPWVTAKLALSLDAKIAGPAGYPVGITGHPCQQLTHRLRLASDAILTTMRTVNQDDPKLNIRFGKKTISKPVFILDPLLRTNDYARIFETAKSLYLLHSPKVTDGMRQRIIDKGAHCIEIPEVAPGLLDLKAAMASLGQEGIHDVWVEAGGRCFENLHAAGLVKRTLLYIAPKMLGANAVTAFSRQDDLFANAQSVKWQQYGSDMVCELEWE